jgi:hypothetical protein
MANRNRDQCDLPSATTVIIREAFTQITFEWSGTW